MICNDNKIEEYSKVSTLMENDGYKAGTVGVVVSIYSAGPACEVELWDENGSPIDVVTFLLDELKPIE